MATYPITINAQSYTLSTSDAAQIAAVGLARAKKNDGQKDEDKIATDALYLEFVFGRWAEANPGFTTEQLNAAFAGAAASYAGQDIPPPADPAELSPEAKLAALKAYAAAKRYAVETGGTSLNGMRISTDRGTQNAVDRTLNAIEKGIASVPVGWKGAEGWIDLDAAALAAIGAAVAKHVQAAFAVERSASDAIDNGSITTIAQIDAAAWPSN